MLSIQEMVDKTVEQRRRLKRFLGSGIFDPAEASIFHNQKPADIQALKESIRNISLAEFLAKSGSTGIAGAIYLIPDKLYDTLIFYSKETDKVPVISAYLAERWDGGDLKVAIVNDETYKPKDFGSGGTLATETVETMLPTLSPTGFGIVIPIGQDLIEDGQWDLVEFHTRQAALAMGEKATDLALTVLKTATDGWGTVNGGASGDADETKYQGATDVDVLQCVQEVGADKWIADTMVTTAEAWAHSISTTGPAAVLPPWALPQTAEGFHFKLTTLDTLIATNDSLHLSTDAEGTFTDCVTIVFNRENAMLTGRKRWMRIENFSNPIEDLAGAVVTGRQDGVTLYDDAIAVITED